MNNMEKALAIARGNFQRQVVMGQHTLGGKTWTNSMRKFSGRYNASVKALLKRLDEANVKYTIERGAFGGLWSARLKIEE